MIIPVVLIPIFTFAFFILTWQGGLAMSIDKKLLPLLFALPVALSFLVIGIVVIVRLCRKLPVLMLVQVLVIEIIAVAAFFMLDYKQNTWLLNQYLYQDKRMAFVERIQTNPNPGQEAAMMDSIQQHRNYPFSIVLTDDEYNLQNRHNVLSDRKGVQSYVTVQRDCDGNLMVEFPYDSEFMGRTYSVLYSDRFPIANTSIIWDENGLPRTSVGHHIDKFRIIDTISPHWYYVANGSSGFNLSFNLFGGGGGSGSSSGGSSGGCQ